MPDMSAAHLTQKGIGSGPSSCYIILEGEQDVLWAPLSGASHVPGNSRLAHMTCKRFRILHARSLYNLTCKESRCKGVDFYRILHAKNLNAWDVDFDMQLQDFHESSSTMVW